VADAARHAESALELVEGGADTSMLAELLAARSMARFLRGEGIDEAAMDRAIALERPGTEVPIEWRPGMTLAMMRRWSGDLAGAGAAFEALHRETLDAGDETSLPFLLAQLSETHTLSGNWRRALETADEAHSLALQTGQEQIRAIALYARALAQAHLGLVEPARDSARDGLELAKRGGSVLSMILCQSVLGFIEVSCEEPAAADECLGPLVAWLDVVGISEPGVIRFVPDEVEALIALGHLDRADALLESFEAGARRLERGWAILAGARARAMHLAAIGETGRAIRSLELAIATYGAGAGPFDRARAMLMLGTVQRRTRRRRVARSSLSEALGLFDALGADLWAARTSALLGASAETVEPAVTASLTPAERRVVELVAAGSTNRAAADRLFVSVRAVEVHLTNTYRKLGVRSRTELAALLSRGRGDDPVEHPVPGAAAELTTSAPPKGHSP
jgi:DNA-binding CsgD family transcriptional regulator